MLPAARDACANELSSSVFVPLGDRTQQPAAPAEQDLFCFLHRLVEFELPELRVEPAGKLIDAAGMDRVRGQPERLFDPDPGSGAVPR